MKNIKKTLLGMLIGLLALSISAYTTKKNGTVLRYYKVSTSTGMYDPRDYQYFLEDRCEPGGNSCSARWDLGTNPTPVNDGEALPQTGITFQTGSVMEGHFE